MNTLLVSSPITQAKPSRKPTLPPPPEHESPLDRAIRVAGVTPISKQAVNLHKRRVLLAEKMQKQIPLWWSGKVQAGMELGTILGLLFSAGCLLWGMICGVAPLKFNAIGATMLYIIPPTVAYTVMCFITLKCERIPWTTPYWVTTSFERFRDMMERYERPISSHVYELVDEIRARLPEAKFRVAYLEYATDPILSVRMRGKGFMRFKRETRYLMMWD